MEINKNLKCTILSVIILTNTNPICKRCVEHIKEYPHPVEDRFYNPGRLTHVSGFDNTISASSGTPTAFITTGTVVFNGNIIINFDYPIKNIN